MALERDQELNGAALDVAHCPLCGGPNNCAMADRSEPGEPCWCTHVRFSDELLASIPPAMQGRACVCAGCVGGP